MQPKMMERHTRALSCVLPGGQTQKMDLRMSSSVSCEICITNHAKTGPQVLSVKWQAHGRAVYLPRRPG